MSEHQASAVERPKGDASVPKHAAVLVGNGLTVAFNPDLNLQSITNEVLNRIGKLDGDDVVAAMKELAERALPDGVKSDKDFEMLVGAFGSESQTLSVLDTLAQLTEPKNEDLRSAIKLVASFAEQVRDSGVSHVLEVIAERSYASQKAARHLNALVGSVIDAFNGDIVFANLNYDTLLLAALLQVCNSELADMGHGWKQVSVTVDDHTRQKVQLLRESSSDFPPNKRVKLLHIHGSLTFWETLDRQVQVKVPTDLVRGSDQWSAVRSQTTNIRPAVVLASSKDKSEHVTRRPFALAYEMHSAGLAKAEHWLIIGYSFRDAPVNNMLRLEFLERKHKPRVLVVTHGENPDLRAVERAFGWGIEDGPSSGWLTINRDGANGAENTDDWRQFVEFET